MQTKYIPALRSYNFPFPRMNDVEPRLLLQGKKRETAGDRLKWAQKEVCAGNVLCQREVSYLFGVQENGLLPGSALSLNITQVEILDAATATA